MADLYHVVLKDHENSGHVWDEFYCPYCLVRLVMKFEHLEILRQAKITPQYLSCLSPPFISEPHCRECGTIFTH